MEFINCGHRGAMSVSPENTMASFQLAAAQGANELELDLRLSKDGVLVVIHDATVDRTTDGSGAVSDMTYDELRALDAGDGQQIPSFDEVLAGTDTRLQVEIKDPDVVDPLVELLRSRPDEVDRISPTCFAADTIAALATRLPGCVVGLIGRAGTPETVTQAAELGARRVLLGWSGTDQALVTRAQERGLHYNVWPVNTPDQLRDAAALGVDGFTTDYPPLMFDHGYRLTDGRLVAP
ncbi:glycerophosphodiester phosphodiesterase [Phytoactinopolyspora halotolerans]|uniref:Glycerophosphodiester phosphodiesterase n=1 Tax=Phytoactinopolyspora halotolerans TaxID=1981512 RepID=A0A6L9S885_9ACTN|nr:glycerophosphodiester phosphodiesterase family protein [Phytoactinopolyspora halotolerans]NEE00738.1 glycerophosphodiester phosphodiesterase [Phytoactinopolyspora halotolerans]